MTKLVLPYEWRQGDHMAVIGRTGTGKTTLMYGMDGKPGLLDWRKYATALRSKGDSANWFGSKRVATAMPAMKDPDLLKIELFPKRGQEAREFKAALKEVWKQKRQAIYFDELFHANAILKLELEINDLMTRGRSLGITVINGLQRPVKVSRFAISQSTHVIAFRCEGRDSKTIAETTTPRILPVLEGLGKHQFVWYKEDEGKGHDLWIGQLQDLWDG